MYGSSEPIDITIKSSGGNIYSKYDYAEGVLSLVKRRHLETSSETARQYYSKYMSEKLVQNVMAKDYQKQHYVLRLMVNQLLI